MTAEKDFEWYKNNQYSWSDMANCLQGMGFTREEIGELPDPLLSFIAGRPVIDVAMLDKVVQRRHGITDDDNVSLNELLSKTLTKEQIRLIRFFSFASD